MKSGDFYKLLNYAKDLAKKSDAKSKEQLKEAERLVNMQNLYAMQMYRHLSKLLLITLMTQFGLTLLQEM